MKKSKILYVSPFPFYPPTTGGERAINAYVRSLAQKYFVIVCAPKSQKQIPYNDVEIYRFYKENKSKYFNIGAYWKIFQLVKKNKFESLVFAFPYQGYFCYLIAKLNRVPIKMHEHNIEFLRFKTLKKWWWPLMYLYEFFLYSFVDAIDSISDSDRQLAIKYLKISPKKISVIPYSADTTVFKSSPEAGKKIRGFLHLDHEKIVLFFGSLDYKPNQEAVEIIEKKIAPEIYKKNQNIKFLIVGRNPPKNIQSPNIIFTGFVDKVEDYINASDIVIVPLLSCGGIRTKILESLACGKKVISTKLGAEGITSVSNKNLVIINDISKFSEKIEDYL